MSWELRSGRRYYTRSRRVAGKIKRIYIGNGPEAELAAAIDATRRVQRKARAEAQRALIAGLQALDGPTRDLEEHVVLLVEAVLLAAGYHRHDRGMWQKRRQHGYAS